VLKDDSRHHPHKIGWRGESRGVVARRVAPLQVEEKLAYPQAILV